MNGFTIDTSRLTGLGTYLGAFESEILAAAPKAANSTATWLRKTFSEKVATLGPEKKLVQAMTNITRAKKGSPWAFVRPSGQRIYAASFNGTRFVSGENPTRGHIEVQGFQSKTTAIGFVNTKAKSENPRPMRTNKKQSNKLAPALGPSPAMLFAEYLKTESDLEEKIYLKLTTYFENNLTKAMNLR
ncbi:hypothetical protein [Reinekea sp.]|jgi:hypothetical protein|uniref:hypothetical protein n=1 Tax=Reinekea sp. TaxID=1970455 RepID=UPI003988C17F